MICVRALPSVALFAGGFVSPREGGSGRSTDSGRKERELKKVCCCYNLNA
jgi:hypothetical protein